MILKLKVGEIITDGQRAIQSVVTCNHLGVGEVQTISMETTGLKYT